MLSLAVKFGCNHYNDNVEYRETPTNYTYTKTNTATYENIMRDDVSPPHHNPSPPDVLLLTHVHEHDQIWILIKTNKNTIIDKTHFNICTTSRRTHTDAYN